MGSILGRWGRTSLALLLVAGGAYAQNAPGDPSVQSRWSGRVKLTGSRADYPRGTLWESLQSHPYHDGRLSLRLNHETFFTPTRYAQIHLESDYASGDTRAAWTVLPSGAQSPAAGLGAGIENPGERRHLLDLSTTLEEGQEYRWGLRLDRFNFTWEAPWGQLRAGRQAVTWGNGYFFNPLDLVNPFTPTQIDRDYKSGADMLAATVNLPNGPELQILLVPRREPLTRNIKEDQSSLAAKLHWMRGAGATEFDLLGARHYGEQVLGWGVRGNLGAAAYRLDASWSFLSAGGSESPSGYLSWVANLDYSWVWRGKNFYGLVEGYFNGLGSSHYSSALRDAPLQARILRGEAFTLGRWQLAGTLQIELHPLVNFFFSSLVNPRDPSALLQPYLTWDVRQNLQLTLGAALPAGGPGTEYGGFQIPGTFFTQQPPALAFGWLTFYY